MQFLKLGFFYMKFNIFSQLTKELDDFFSSSILISSGAQHTPNTIPNSRNRSTYTFSQWNTLNTVEMYYNSQFTSGKIDSEGQRKLFLNICKFRSDVASKQIDLDVKDFKFIPEDDTSVWGAYFVSKEFKKWAKEEYLSEFINEMVIDLPKYGTAVGKVVKGNLSRVPIKNIRCQIDARSLNDSVYVIEEHANMNIHQLKQMSLWDISNLKLDMNDTVTVYERYGRVPRAYLNAVKGMPVSESDHDDFVDTMAIIVLHPKRKKSEVETGEILFIEEVDKRPYEEVHWSKVDGRWLGIGEIENQFENQIAQNLVMNMRRRGLLWSSRKLFQSTDVELPDNLLKDVRDGEIMKVMPNGQISQINNTTQNLAEFQSTQNVWDRNSDQKSFTFEIATGESLPSGTPFRLGVVMSNAVNSHFALKRENLGLFLKRLIQDHVYPVFKVQRRKEHLVQMFEGDEGLDRLRAQMIDIHTNNNARETLLNGVMPDMEKIRNEVVKKIDSKPELFFKIPEGFYNSLKLRIDLIITGESVDVPRKIETLTTLYNVLAQQGDPNAQRILKKILALTGENLDALSGEPPQKDVVSQIQAQFPTGAQTEAVPQEATL